MYFPSILLSLILKLLILEEICAANMLIIWGKVNGVAWPEKESYQSWYECVETCSKMDSCVLAASSSDPPDECVIYKFYNVTYTQSGSENSSKLAIKMMLNDSVCPEISQKPPMFGQSVLQMTMPNPNGMINGLPSGFRNYAYTISQDSEEGHWIFTYYGCMSTEVQYYENGIYYCVENDVTAADTAIDSVCAYYGGAPFVPSTMEKFELLKSWAASPPADYWMSSKLATGCEYPSSCDQNTRFLTSTGAYAIGQWSANTCSQYSQCQPCLILRDGELLDVDCSTSGKLVCEYKAYQVVNKTVIQ